MVRRNAKLRFYLCPVIFSLLIIGALLPLNPFNNLSPLLHLIFLFEFALSPFALMSLFGFCR